MYAPQEEIRAYLEHCADKYDVRRHIVFNTRAISATWDTDAGLWRCVAEGPDGRVERTARFVVSGIGGLHVPATPDFPGIENFEGDVFHSATWNHDVRARGQERRRDRHRRQRDPVRPRDRAEGRPPRPLPAHCTLGPAQARPAHHALRAPAVSPLPVPPARVSARDLLVPRARDAPRSEVAALRAPVRVHGPAEHRASGKGSGQAREADAELRVRLQAPADVERLLPRAGSAERRRGHRRDRRDQGALDRGRGRGRARGGRDHPRHRLRHQGDGQLRGAARRGRAATRRASGRQRGSRPTAAR